MELRYQLSRSQSGQRKPEKGLRLREYCLIEPSFIGSRVLNRNNSTDQARRCVTRRGLCWEHPDSEHSELILTR